MSSPPLSGTTSAALEIIVKQDDAAWCPEVHGLFRRANPDSPAPEPHLWMASLKFLLRHGYRREEVLAALSGAGGYEMGEAVLLALEHAPEVALPLIRRTLRSRVPANRCAVAQPTRAVPVRPSERCVRLLGGCCPIGARIELTRRGLA